MEKGKLTIHFKVNEVKKESVEVDISRFGAYPTTKQITDVVIEEANKWSQQNLEPGFFYQTNYRGLMSRGTTSLEVDFWSREHYDAFIQSVLDRRAEDAE